MLDRAARLARLGTRLVSALAGLLMLALLAFGGFALWQDAALRRGAFVGAELLQYKPAAPAADNPTLAGLQTVNPDVCGWLTVDGTGIDYPVVQGATNMDYVNRDVYGDFSLSGAIFLDSRCAADLTDPYTVIYGHHMDNSAMFGDVARFAEADYFAAHPAGSISLPDAAYTIELFACGGAAGLCGGAGRAAAGHRCDGAGPAGGAFDLRRERDKRAGRRAGAALPPERRR